MTNKQNSKPQNSSAVAPKGPAPEPKAVVVPDTWPGAFETFKLVKPSVKRILWTLIGSYALLVIVNTIFRRIPVLGIVVTIIAYGMFEAVIISLYFAALKNQDIGFNKGINNGVSKLLTMIV